MAEVYFFDNLDTYPNTGGHHSKAYYAQLGYRAPWIIPYVRYERTLLDQTDQFFKPAGDRHVLLPAPPPACAMTST